MAGGWKKVDSLIVKRIRKAGIEEKTHEARVLDAARRVITQRWGAKSAERAAPRRFRHNTLMITCSDTVLITEIKFHERSVRKDIENTLPGTTIKSIQIGL